MIDKPFIRHCIRCAGFAALITVGIAAVLAGAGYALVWIMTYLGPGWFVGVVATLMLFGLAFRILIDEL